MTPHFPPRTARVVGRALVCIACVFAASAPGDRCTQAAESPADNAAMETTAGSAPDMAVQPSPADGLQPPVALDTGTGPAVDATRPARPAAISTVTLAVIAVAGAALVTLRFTARRRGASLPPDVFDVLGTASLGGHHAVRVVRFGPKTLLVSVSAGGCRTLAEVADPQATACIVAACRGAHPPHTPRPKASAIRAAALLAAALLTGAAPAMGDESRELSPVVTAATDGSPADAPWADLAARLAGGRSLDAVLSAAVMFGVATLAPAALLMTTSFVRISVVLSLLRQGLGTQHLPSNQIVTSLAIFLSALVMWPVWTQAWRAGVEPYQQGTIGLREAAEQGTLPIRRWMAGQIEQAGNRDTMLLFLKRHPDAPREVKTYDDVPTTALLPAFLVSELETAFTIGFRLLLPFLVLDVVVATLVVSTGLVMLPPTLVSLPLKLLVFVMADGWSLVVQSLLDGLQVTSR